MPPCRFRTRPAFPHSCRFASSHVNFFFILRCVTTLLDAAIYDRYSLHRWGRRCGSAARRHASPADLDIASAAAAARRHYTYMKPHFNADILYGSASHRRIGAIGNSAARFGRMTRASIFISSILAFQEDGGDDDARFRAMSIGRWSFS